MSPLVKIGRDVLRLSVNKIIITSNYIVIEETHSVSKLITVHIRRPDLYNRIHEETNFTMNLNENLFTCGVYKLLVK